MLLLTGNIYREEAVFAEKMICGIRNETSGQSWPPNPVATEPITRGKKGSAIIRAGEVVTPSAPGHTRYGTEEMDFDPVCLDDCRTVICREQDCAGEATGYPR